MLGMVQEMVTCFEQGVFVIKDNEYSYVVYLFYFNLYQTAIVMSPNAEFIKELLG